MKVAELKEILAEIAAIYKAGGAPRAAENFVELATLFDGAENADLLTYLGDLRRLYVPKPSMIADNANCDELHVGRWLKQLQGLPADGSGDNRMMRSLKADGALGEPEANVLQHRFIGGRRTWPSRNTALDAIRDSLAHRRREDANLERMKNTTPW